MGEMSKSKEPQPDTNILTTISFRPTAREWARVQKRQKEDLLASLKVRRWLLMEALGTADVDFINGLLNQLDNASNDESGLDFMLAVTKGLKPKDHLEAMLVAQMAAVHIATMRYAGNLVRFESLKFLDSAERTLNKLARTFTTQMEALKRYRSGGEQKVTVRHVSVNEGGQAIVGNVTQGKSEAALDRPAHLKPDF